MPDRAQKDLDTDQGIAGLEQALGDRQQAIEDREQRSLDREQAVLDREVHAGKADAAHDAEQHARQAQARLAQTRRAASQDVLDDAQRARDEHQILLDDQQADLDAPPPVTVETPAQAERRRAEQLLARADAMDARAEDAARRAAEARRRAHAGPGPDLRRRRVEQPGGSQPSPDTSGGAGEHDVTDRTTVSGAHPCGATPIATPSGPVTTPARRPRARSGPRDREGCESSWDQACLLDEHPVVVDDPRDLAQPVRRAGRCGTACRSRSPRQTRRRGTAGGGRRPTPARRWRRPRLSWASERRSGSMSSPTSCRGRQSRSRAGECHAAPTAHLQDARRVRDCQGRGRARALRDSAGGRCAPARWERAAYSASGSTFQVVAVGGGGTIERCVSQNNHRALTLTSPDTRSGPAKPRYATTAGRSPLDVRSVEGRDQCRFARALGDETAEGDPDPG